MKPKLISKVFEWKNAIFFSRKFWSYCRQSQFIEISRIRHDYLAGCNSCTIRSNLHFFLSFVELCICNKKVQLYFCKTTFIISIWSTVVTFTIDLSAFVLDILYASRSLQFKILSLLLCTHWTEKQRYYSTTTLLWCFTS